MLFDIQRTANLAREWGFARPGSSDDHASQCMLSRIYTLRNRHPAQCVAIETNGKCHPFVALCRDVKAKRKEDAKIPRKDILPVKTCLRIQKLLGAVMVRPLNGTGLTTPEYDSSDVESGERTSRELLDGDR